MHLSVKVSSEGHKIIDYLQIPHPPKGEKISYKSYIQRLIKDFKGYHLASTNILSHMIEYMKDTWIHQIPQSWYKCDER